jgi:hypothetical protein
VALWASDTLIPFSELALEVGHVGLVLELVQVLHHLRGCMLRDTLGTRIVLAMLVGAHCNQARNVRDEVLGYLGNLRERTAARPDLNVAMERY